MSDDLTIRAPLKDILEQFQTSIRVERLGNDFVGEVVHVSDPNGAGLAFDVGVGPTGGAVFLNIDGLPTRDLTVAEASTAEEILAVVGDILAGEVNVTTKLLWSLFEFPLDNRRSYRTFVFGRRSLVASYRLRGVTGRE
jgi:hypothetical protein